MTDTDSLERELAEGPLMCACVWTHQPGERYCLTHWVEPVAAFIREREKGLLDKYDALGEERDELASELEDLDAALCPDAEHSRVDQARDMATEWNRARIENAALKAEVELLRLLGAREVNLADITIAYNDAARERDENYGEIKRIRTACDEWYRRGALLVNAIDLLMVGNGPPHHVRDARLFARHALEEWRKP